MRKPVVPSVTVLAAQGQPNGLTVVRQDARMMATTLSSVFLAARSGALCRPARMFMRGGGPTASSCCLAIRVIVYATMTRQKNPKEGVARVKPVSRTTLVEQVGQQILQLISEGRWKAGEKLPSESELCRGFHVGRSTVREALRSLALAGMLRTRAGDGTYVAEGPPGILGRVFAPGLLETEKDMNDLFEARRVLEAGAAALCAERATEEDLQNLERLAKELQLYPNDPAGRDQELDVAFHLAMAAASKNEILARLLGAIRHLLREAVATSRQFPGSYQLACSEHLEIVQALKERNPRKARRAVHRHLWSFQQAYEILAHAPKSQPEAQAREVRPGQNLRA